MRLFVYDRKHEQINHVLNLGEITKDQEEIIGKVANFLAEAGITNRYD